MKKLILSTLGFAFFLPIFSKAQIKFTDLGNVRRSEVIKISRWKSTSGQLDTAVWNHLAPRKFYEHCHPTNPSLGAPYRACNCSARKISSLPLIIENGFDIPLRLAVYGLVIRPQPLKSSE